MYYHCRCCGYPYSPRYASCPRCLMQTPRYLRRKARSRRHAGFGWHLPGFVCRLLRLLV